MILDCCSSPVIPVVTFLTPLAEHLSFTRLRRQAVCVVSVTYHCGQDVSLSLTTQIGVNLALVKMDCRGKHAGAHSDSAAQGPTGPQELTFLGQNPGALLGPVAPREAHHHMVILVIFVTLFYQTDAECPPSHTFSNLESK